MQLQLLVHRFEAACATAARPPRATAGAAAAAFLLALPAPALHAATGTIAGTTAVAFTGQIVSYTVTQPGLYRITAVGAEGAGSSEGGTRAFINLGGGGATMAGDFMLSADLVIDVLVGQGGRPGSGGRGIEGGFSAPAATAAVGGAGGGGGSFVVLHAGTQPPVVAGGGGGATGAFGNGYGKGASAGTGGVRGNNNGGFDGSAGGTGGGGGASTELYGAGGGGGFYGDGADASSGGTGGTSFVHGGVQDPRGKGGGFGGGGGWGLLHADGSYFQTFAGGGGGGYSGGGAGYGAGGGGSFLSGVAVNRSLTAGLNGVSHTTGSNGSVLFQLLVATPIPEPATPLLMAAGLLAVALAARRPRQER